MMEDKIIDDVLIYLDGWELQNKSHKIRHKPHPPKYLDAFNDDSEEIEDTNVRKTVTSNEILTMYEVAKVHVLNYIKRPVFPRTPTTHIAICMWTAGLLSQKSRFRKQRVESSYNLISEAKKLLKPHVNVGAKVIAISGRPPHCDDDIENYRFYREPNPKCCKKIHKRGTHHHHHHPCVDDHPPHHHKPKPPHFEYDEPDYDDFFLRGSHGVKLTLMPTSTHGDGSITLKATITNDLEDKIDEGKVLFYLEAEDSYELEGGENTRRSYIGEAYVTDGIAEYIWAIPEEIPTGKRTLYASYQEYDDYISAVAYTDITVKRGVIITVDDLKSIPGRENIPLIAHITDTNNTPLNEGVIQFQINQENIGTPVPVINGLATYTLDVVPDTLQNGDAINVIYYGTQTYADSMANTQGIFVLLKETVIHLEDISANPSETINIEATLTDEDGVNPVTDGEYTVYLDDILLQSDELNTSGKIFVEYTLSDDLSYGEHTLNITYNGNNTYIAVNKEVAFNVRYPITMEIDDITGSLTETITLTTHITTNNQPVNAGEVTYYIDY